MPPSEAKRLTPYEAALHLLDEETVCKKGNSVSSFAEARAIWKAKQGK